MRAGWHRAAASSRDRGRRHPGDRRGAGPPWPRRPRLHARRARARNPARARRRPRGDGRARRRARRAPPAVLHVVDLARLGAGVLDVAAARGVRTIVDAHDLWLLCARGTLVARGRQPVRRPDARRRRLRRLPGLPRPRVLRLPPRRAAGPRSPRASTAASSRRPSARATLVDAGLPAELLAVVPPATDERGVEALVDRPRADLRRRSRPPCRAGRRGAALDGRPRDRHEPRRHQPRRHRAPRGPRRPGRAAAVAGSRPSACAAPPAARAAVEVRHQWPPAFDDPGLGPPRAHPALGVRLHPDAWVGAAARRRRRALGAERVRAPHVRRRRRRPPTACTSCRTASTSTSSARTARRCALDAPAGTRFLFVGGTIYRKGIDVLCPPTSEAFAGRDDVHAGDQGRRRRRRLQRHNVGDELRACADDRRLPRVVYLDDDLDDEGLAALYRGCDVLVHPYRGEGFAMPVLEAMACGLPVRRHRRRPDRRVLPDDARLAHRRDPPLPAAPVLRGRLAGRSSPWMLEPDADRPRPHLLREAAADRAARARRGAAGRSGRRGLRAGRDRRAVRRAPRAPSPPARCAARSRAGRSRSRCPTRRGLNLLATPAWRGTDRLAELLAAWREPRSPRTTTSRCTCWPTRRATATPTRGSARVLAAVDAAGVGLEALADIALLEHAGVRRRPAAHPRRVSTPTCRCTAAATATCASPGRRAAAVARARRRRPARPCRAVRRAA